MLHWRTHSSLTNLDLYQYELRKGNFLKDTVQSRKNRVAALEIGPKNGEPYDLNNISPYIYLNAVLKYFLSSNYRQIIEHMCTCINIAQQMLQFISYIFQRWYWLYWYIQAIHTLIEIQESISSGFIFNFIHNSPLKIYFDVDCYF